MKGGGGRKREGEGRGEERAREPEGRCVLVEIRPKNEGVGP